MKYSAQLALLLMATVTLFSCKDDNPPTQSCPMTAASLANRYQLTSLKLKPSGGVESEIIGTLNACQRDNFLVLNSNTTFNYQDAGVVCTPNGSYAGDWDVTANTLRLETEMATITSWDCTNLVFFVNNKPGAGDRTTYTYKKQ